MADRIHLQIVTAGGVVYDAQVSEISVPLEGGKIGILADHAPLMGAVADGVVVSTKADGSKGYAAVGIGVMNVVQNEVTLLVRAAENAENIDLGRAEAAEQRARERLAQRDGVDLLRAEASLHRALARQDAVNMAGKRKI